MQIQSYVHSSWAFYSNLSDILFNFIVWPSLHAPEAYRSAGRQWEKRSIYSKNLSLYYIWYCAIIFINQQCYHPDYQDYRFLANSDISIGHTAVI